MRLIKLTKRVGGKMDSGLLSVAAALKLKTNARSSGRSFGAVGQADSLSSSDSDDAFDASPDPTFSMWALSNRYNRAHHGGTRATSPPALTCAPTTRCSLLPLPPPNRYNTVRARTAYHFATVRPPSPVRSTVQGGTMPTLPKSMCQTTSDARRCHRLPRKSSSPTGKVRRAWRKW